MNTTDLKQILAKKYKRRPQIADESHKEDDEPTDPSETVEQKQGPKRENLFVLYVKEVTKGKDCKNWKQRLKYTQNHRRLNEEPTYEQWRDSYLKTNTKYIHTYICNKTQTRLTKEETHALYAFTREVLYCNWECRKNKKGSREYQKGTSGTIGMSIKQSSWKPFQISNQQLPRLFTKKLTEPFALDPPKTLSLNFDKKLLNQDGITTRRKYRYVLYHDFFQWWDKFNFIINKHGPETFYDLKMNICSEYATERYNYTHQRKKKTKTLGSTFYWFMFSGQLAMKNTKPTASFPEHPCPDKKRIRKKKNPQTQHVN